MNKIIFYPIGNADTCLFQLADNRVMLFDYANMRDNYDKNDKRIDLEVEIRKALKSLNKKFIDVVAFTHADVDHINRFSEFFYLTHAKKYQDNERIEIKELWVPAAIILEEGTEGDASILRAEARHRLINGEGIKVFSRPQRLEEWLKRKDIKIESRKDLIIDAGRLIPGFDDENEGVQFFVHSPFAIHSEENFEDRNECALIFHVTFIVNTKTTKMFLIGDTTFSILKDIISITKRKKREERLEWDIFDIPHHCSYLALSQEKGIEMTEPDDDIKYLLDKGNNRCKLISCSNTISNEETKMPPHFQAANFYKRIAKSKNGEFLVTMDHPDANNPQPLEIIIDELGAKINRSTKNPAIVATSQKAPRAGK